MHLRDSKLALPVCHACRSPSAWKALAFCATFLLVVGEDVHCSLPNISPSCLYATFNHSDLAATTPTPTQHVGAASQGSGCVSVLSHFLSHGADHGLTVISYFHIVLDFAIVCLSSVMSDIPPQPFIFPKPVYAVFCDECRDELEWRVVTRTTKGNRGRWYATCAKLTAEGKPECFKWGSPKSTPAHSPPLRSSPTLPPVADQVVEGQQDDAQAAAAPPSHSCAILNCSSTRLAAGCEHHCCRKHCVALGGCSLRKHRMTPAERKRFTAIDPTLLAPPNDTQPTSSLGSPILSPQPLLSVPADRSGLSSPQLAGPSRPPSSAPAVRVNPVSHSTSKGKERAADVDMLASSRHPSQMPAVFTQGYAQQEALRQQKEAMDVEQRMLDQAAANTVDAYGWHMPVDETEASSLQLQHGFSFPKLRITSTLLTGLGLVAGDDGQHLVQYFSPTLCRWTNIFQGHVVTLESPQIYLRNVGVSKMLDFDNVINQYTTTSAIIPHLRTNLAAERASVRRANHQDLTARSCPVLKSLPSVIELTSGSSDDEPQASSSKNSRPLQHARRPQTQPVIIELPSDPSDVDDGTKHNMSTMSLTSSTGHSGSFVDPIDVDEPQPASKRVWPRDFYTFEVAEVFRAVTPGTNAKKAFARIYGSGITFHASTFSEHLKRWNAAPFSSRMKFIEAGETEMGKYVLFMKANPSPDGEVKAAKKRLARKHNN